jgi:hypothetical protein
MPAGDVAAGLVVTAHEGGGSLAVMPMGQSPTGPASAAW